jgi:hypothetical protein
MKASQKATKVTKGSRNLHIRDKKDSGMNETFIGLKIDGNRFRRHAGIRDPVN